MPMLNLEPVDSVEITTVLDNYADSLMTGDNRVKRSKIVRHGQIMSGPLAEHGFSLLITLKRGTTAHTILLDAGWSEITVPYNLQLLDIPRQDVEAIVLSHGHMDHFGGLAATLKYLEQPNLPVVCHPEVFQTERYQLAPGRRFKFPVLAREAITKAGGRLVESTAPYLLAGEMLATTGEITRRTAFEHGIPNAVIKTPSGDRPDDFIDDLGLVAVLKGKGLVVISGCAHAGIINTVLMARELTGIEKIHTIAGGFHLNGPLYAEAAAATRQELQNIHPEVLIPMHCTGWETIRQLSLDFPRQFIQNAVGSRFILS